MTEPTVVNSWNEWDPLGHIIVGRADGSHIPAPEPALDAKVPEDSDMRGQWGRRPQDHIDRANELLDGFARLLERRGIRVDVDKLMIDRGVGELVHLLLRDFQPVSNTDFLADMPIEIINGYQ